MVNIYPLVRGVASYVFPTKVFKRPGSGGTFSSEYCYSVWLRHLVQLKEAGLIQNTNDIKSLAEIGPGDSLGIGMAAMYTGVEHYYAFDVIKHANGEMNKTINSELLTFFLNKKDIPSGTYQFRNTNPVLKDYAFPLSIINSDKSDFENRYHFIEKNIQNLESESSNIKYVVPWMGEKQTQVKEIDLIISQAVMEHVDDLEFAYVEMFRWLKKGGIMSHQIDFKAHEMTKEWDGHFYIKSGLWNILAHGRKYPMNRLPFSSHINAIQKAGFTIRNIVPVLDKNNFLSKHPRVPGVNFQSNDFITSSALVQAIKD
jgi:SAM-dependent methyltransferase